MTNMIRARNNAGQSKQPAQAKTRAIKVHRKPGVGNHPIALTVFNHKTDNQMAGCDISPAAWRLLQAAAEAQGKSVGSLLENTLQEIVMDTSKEQKAHREYEDRHRQEFTLDPECHPTCLALYDRLSKGPVSKVPLSEKEMLALLSLKAKNPGATEELIADSIRARLADMVADKEKKCYNAMSELETAHQQAAAMMQLMLDSESHRLMEGDLNHDERNHINAGVLHLVEFTKDRLSKAFEQTFEANKKSPAFNAAAFVA